VANPSGGSQQLFLNESGSRVFLAECAMVLRIATAAVVQETDMP
jgi:hypothetical protein